MTKTYKIKRAFVEGTQRGYVMGVYLSSGKKVDLSYYSDSEQGYRECSTAASSVQKFGQWLGRDRGFLFSVKGKTLNAEKL